MGGVIEEVSYFTGTKLRFLMDELLLVVVG